MSINRRFTLWILALLVPPLAIYLSVANATGTWERVKTKPEIHTLRVTGSATKRIVSDLIEWKAEIGTLDADRTAAYKSLKSHVDATRAYLVKQGVPLEDIRVSSVSSYEVIENETVGVGSERVQRRVSRGWSTEQTISVRSHDIAVVERVSREVTDLLEQGVPITSRPPQYHYTKLSEVKVDMLASASEDARTRADRIVKAAGGKGIQKLVKADMGVININPANSTSTSWEGNNDKSSLEKDIITIVHLSYELP